MLLGQTVVWQVEVEVPEVEYWGVLGGHTEVPGLLGPILCWGPRAPILVAAFLLA